MSISLILIWIAVWGSIGYYIGPFRGYEPINGALMCAFLGPIGILILAVTTGPDAPDPTAAMPSVDAADQICKLAQLRDDGVLTAAEFDTKKRELLARM